MAIRLARSRLSGRERARINDIMSQMTFRHLGVAVPNLEQAITTYHSIFNYTLLSGPFDDPLQRVAVCFMGIDRPREIMIELVAPLDSSSPVGRMLAKGIGAYHTCYAVADIEGTLAAMRANGCVIVSPPKPAVAFDGRRIAWFYMPTRQLVELVEE